MKTSVSLKSLAKMIDHSLLHPTMTDDDIVAGCRLSRKYDVATACVKPYAIRLAADVLSGSAVDVCSVIAFPHGNSTTSIKVSEAESALREGATEIDMVVNVGKLLSGEWSYVSHDIKAVNDVVIANDALLKVIFENDYLEDGQIIKLCEICGSHGVAFVKTSSGYGFVKQSNGMYSYKGATDHHLRLMRQYSPARVQLKAAGGIRTLDDLLRVRDLGVTRIGVQQLRVSLKRRSIVATSEAESSGLTEPP